MSKDTSILQAEAIPLRDNKICLVTSRSGRHWVIPKGCLEPGKTEGEIALQEAWEEVGLVRNLAPDSSGELTFTKSTETAIRSPRFSWTSPHSPSSGRSVSFGSALGYDRTRPWPASPTVAFGLL
jgi:8-oxo-dGTP pyrophosphatase MutT (NUDIX family)